MNFRPGDLVRAVSESAYALIQRSLTQCDGGNFKYRSDREGKDGRLWVVIKVLEKNLFDSHPVLCLLCPVSHNLPLVAGVESYELDPGEFCVAPPIPYDPTFLVYGLAAVIEPKMLKAAEGARRDMGRRRLNVFEMDTTPGNEHENAFKEHWNGREHLVVDAWRAVR